ncbi:MAG: TetR/AcrR family transcriptional regulator [Anaerolineales bacterium]|nr:TetR/AcrR family transcriptional regulator [Anaerolineales bacterium]
MVTKTNRIGRQRILEVAEELFTAHGYRAVSIRDIAQACEVTNAALYYHFPSKEALFNEVLEHHAANLSERMTRAGESAHTSRKKVEAILVEYAEVTIGRRSPFFLLRREAATIDKSPPKEHIGKMIHAMLQPLEDVLAKAIENGELRPVPNGNSPAALLVGMLHGMMQHKRTCQICVVTKQDISFVVDVFWEGLGT